MEDIILVLTNTKDGKHSDVVTSALLAKGTRVFRLNVDAIASGKTEIVFTTSSVGSRFVVKDNDSCCKSEEVRSVWYRRPNQFDFRISDPVQQKYAEAELRSLLEGLWTVLEHNGVFFVSNPTALEKSRKKLLQLELAAQMGMLVPKTIISNNPEEVLEFYAASSHGVVCKAINQEYLDYGDIRYRIPTTLVTSAHLRNINLVRRSPTLFQEFIDKSHELRVTVVGNDVFAVKIDSQANPLTAVDWRNPALIADINYSKVDISDALAEFCLKMTKKLGLQFGAFDFVVDKEGRTVFLEINPNGQWYWIEERTGLRISDAIVRVLLQERG